MTVIENPRSYSELGGAWVLTATWWRIRGSFSVTWPFAVLTVSADSLVLSVLWWRYSFKRSEIVSIASYRFVPLLASGIRISHRAPAIPPFVIFWSFSKRRLVSELCGLGYDVYEN